MQVRVAEQSVDGFDVVLDVSGARAVSPELSERRLAAEDERLHDTNERRRALRVPDNRPLLEPS
jgi:hypothetical protein